MTKFIDAVVNRIVVLEGIDHAEAFGKLITYLTVHMMTGSEATSILKTQTVEYLDNTIDIESLRSAKRDFIGEFYISKILHKKDLFPNVNYDMIESDIKKDYFPTLLFIDNCMTGHAAIELCNKHGKENLILYCKSNDLMMYRICLINKHLFDLPLFCLYIDKQNKNADQIDLRINSINWTYANRWNPTKTNLLKTLS